MSEQPSWLDQPIPGPPEAAPPAPPQPEQVPAWVTPQPKGSRLWIYMTGLLLIVVIAGGGIWVRGQLLANQASDQAAQTSPTPLIPDYERADRYLNTTLAPALTGTITPLQNIERDCSAKTMTAPCKPDLIALNQAMLGADDALNQQRDIPRCIAIQVNQFRFDWMGMEQGLSLAISGYNNNSYDLYLQGLVKFGGLAQYLKPDMDRISTAENTCAKTV